MEVKSQTFKPYETTNTLYKFFFILTECKAAAKFMFTGTIALGCKSYKDAQFHACICNEKNDHDDL